MKLGNPNFIFLCFCFILLSTFSVFSEDKIQSVPLINLENLSPTFEEDKDELEKDHEKNVTLNKDENIYNETKSTENNVVYLKDFLRNEDYEEILSLDKDKTNFVFENFRYARPLKDDFVYNIFYDKKYMDQIKYTLNTTLGENIQVGPSLRNI